LGLRRGRPKATRPSGFQVAVSSGTPEWFNRGARPRGGSPRGKASILRAAAFIRQRRSIPPVIYFLCPKKARGGLSPLLAPGSWVEAGGRATLVPPHRASISTAGLGPLGEKNVFSGGKAGGRDSRPHVGRASPPGTHGASGRSRGGSSRSSVKRLRRSSRFCAVPGTRPGGGASVDGGTHAKSPRPCGGPKKGRDRVTTENRGNFP